MFDVFARTHWACSCGLAKQRFLPGFGTTWVSTHVELVNLLGIGVKSFGLVVSRRVALQDLCLYILV